MAELTNQLMYEVLRSIQGDLRMLKDGQQEIRQELIAVRGQIVSIGQDINNIYSVLSRHEERLDRIERRLELREFSERSQTPFDSGP
ncbi:MAG: hypothetical protein ACXIVF_18145 [Rhizobiaceae bacterium]